MRIHILSAAFAALFSIVLLALAGTAQAGSPVKARLTSPNASEEASGTLTLDGYNLSGHLSGGSIDVTITGTVKSSSVEVEVAGHIVPGCSLNRQTISGASSNNGVNTEIQMEFSCPTRGSGYNGGTDYLFQLDLALPPQHLRIPSDSGEDAAIDPLSHQVQRDLT